MFQIHILYIYVSVVLDVTISFKDFILFFKLVITPMAQCQNLADVILDK